MALISTRYWFSFTWLLAILIFAVVLFIPPFNKGWIKVTPVKDSYSGEYSEDSEVWLSVFSKRLKVDDNSKIVPLLNFFFKPSFAIKFLSVTKCESPSNKKRVT